MPPHAIRWVKFDGYTLTVCVENESTQKSRMYTLNGSDLWEQLKPVSHPEGMGETVD